MSTGWRSHCRGGHGGEQRRGGCRGGFFLPGGGGPAVAGPAGAAPPRRRPAYPLCLPRHPARLARSYVLHNIAVSARRGGGTVLVVLWVGSAGDQWNHISGAGTCCACGLCCDERCEGHNYLQGRSPELVPAVHHLMSEHARLRGNLLVYTWCTHVYMMQHHLTPTARNIFRTLFSQAVQ